MPSLSSSSEIALESLSSLVACNKRSLRLRLLLGPRRVQLSFLGLFWMTMIRRAFTSFSQTRDWEKVLVPPFWARQKIIHFVSLISVSVSVYLHTLRTSDFKLCICSDCSCGPQSWKKYGILDSEIFWVNGLWYFFNLHQW